MIKRNPKSEEVKEKMNRLLTGQREEYENGEAMLSAFIRLAVQRAIQEGLEAEVSEHLGRGHYKHRTEEHPAGFRNGYRESQFDTADGAIAYAKPQVRETHYESKLLESLATRPM